MTFSIVEYCSHLTTVAPGIENIWLFGSRANGTANDESDWDLLVFGRGDVLDRIRNNSTLHVQNVDCLVVLPNGDFENAWGSNPKTGSLEEWCWKEFGTEATYQQNKNVGSGDGWKVERKTVKARRVWPLA